MIRVIAKTIDSVQPHGEPLIIYRTFDLDLPDLEAWLTKSGCARDVVGVEVRYHEHASPPPPDREKEPCCPHCLFTDCQCSDFDVSPDTGAQ